MFCCRRCRSTALAPEDDLIQELRAAIDQKAGVEEIQEIIDQLQAMKAASDDKAQEIIEQMQAMKAASADKTQKVISQELHAVLQKLLEQVESASAHACAANAHACAAAAAAAAATTTMTTATHQKSDGNI